VRTGLESGAGEPTLPGAAVRPGEVEGTLAPGTMVERYVVLDRLGTGAMGVVVAAYDPRLDRKIALKLLLPGVDPGAGAQARLLAEAQALARLSHPNVVTVHDAGTWSGRVFVAMELVPGRSLRVWQRERPRSWRDVITMFARAGRGLQAAHAAGIVHRDFKPDNVLVDDDGRARVMDFGLAHGIGKTTADASAGTPAYMAPEQFAGESTDARADQFAFCVALHEALWSMRPFAGDTFAALALQVEQGMVREPPRDGVPMRVRRAIRRGLARRRDDRWPDMGALLDELERAAAPPVRRGWIVLALAPIGVALAIGRLDGGADRCEAAERALAGVWDDARRQALRGAFAATNAPFAAATADRVEAVIDPWAARLVQHQRSSCLAADGGEISAHMLDLRVACLDARRAELASLLEAFEQVDPASVARAGAAVESLPDLDRCVEGGWLLAQVEPPSDPGLRARVDELEERRLEIEARRIARGTPTEAEDARDLVTAATETGYRPLMGRAQLLVARTLAETDRAEPAAAAAKAAFLTAVEAGDDETAFAAAAQLVWAIGFQQWDAPAGREWAEHARALAVRLGDRPQLRADIAHHLASVEFRAGDYAAALAAGEEALALRRELHGDEQADVAAAHLSRGLALYGLGRFAGALADFDGARDLNVRTLGSSHPTVAGCENNRGLVLDLLGRHEEALAAHRRAIEIWTASGAGATSDIAGAWSNLGTVYDALGRGPEALAAHEQALALAQADLGPDHPHLAVPLTNLGIAQAVTGDLEGSIAAHERALAIRERAYGLEHDDVANSLVNLGSTLLSRGDTARAVATLERALAIREKVLPADHPSTATAAYSLSDALLAAGRRDRAQVLAARAVRILEATHSSADHLAPARFSLARALYPDDPVRARELAARAIADLEAIGPGREDLAAMRTWLASPR
jgi:tetratricopeptide (TPR) repeat protein